MTTFTYKSLPFSVELLGGTPRIKFGVLRDSRLVMPLFSAAELGAPWPGIRIRNANNTNQVWLIVTKRSGAILTAEPVGTVATAKGLPFTTNSGTYYLKATTTAPV